MKKITHSSASTTRPSYSSTGTEGFFQLHTVVNEDWLNDIQGMFIDLFSRVGVTPTAGAAGDRNLYDAINALVSGISAPIPTGSRMMFFNNTIPAGWVVVNDDTTTNRMIRVVNTAGGTIGGIHSPIINDKIPDHTHTVVGQVITSTTESVDHTHGFSANTGTGSADHQHTFTDRFYPESSPRDAGTWLNGPTGAGSSSTDTDNNWIKYATDVTAPAGSNHVHGVSGNTGGRSAAHNHTVTIPASTTSSPTSPANYQPRYLDGIVCEKL